ncbi:hypothetical protein PM082_000092 [Marasmius tenuissimus]|nr:hypothetical protein PM082_000092 [Marasmius tenuissimus]
MPELELTDVQLVDNSDMPLPITPSCIPGFVKKFFKAPANSKKGVLPTQVVSFGIGSLRQFVKPRTVPQYGLLISPTVSKRIRDATAVDPPLPLSAPEESDSLPEDFDTGEQQWDELPPSTTQGMTI